MNIRNIIKRVIKSYISEEMITNAVEYIIEQEFDMEEYLSDSEKLKDLVIEEFDNAISEELSDY